MEMGKQIGGQTMYNIKKGEISIEYGKDKIRIYYCPEDLSGDEKIEVIKNVESEYGQGRSYEIHKVREGYPVSAKPGSMSVWLPPKPKKLEIKKEPKEEGKVPAYTVEYDKDEEIYNILINVEGKIKKDSEKIILKEVFDKIPSHSRYRIIWHYQDYDVIDDPKQIDDMINAIQNTIGKTINDQKQVDSFRKEIDKYDELAELEASWNAEFTGKNTKK